jgi:hypothetical protein
MIKKSGYSYRITLDLDTDMDNWYCGCNGVGHGVVWSDRIAPELVEKIKDKSKDEAYKFLEPYLKQKYIDDKDKIEKFKLEQEYIFNDKFINACDRMVELLGKPLYRNDFTIYLTTFPRAPYWYEKGATWMPIGWNDPIRIFLHELCHFQFIHYWRKNLDSAVSKLTDKQFEYIKESLTMVLDEDFLPLIDRIDKGYEMHQAFRKELTEFWKTNKSFDELVNFGLKKLLEFVD